MQRKAIRFVIATGMMLSFFGEILGVDPAVASEIIIHETRTVWTPKVVQSSSLPGSSPAEKGTDSVMSGSWYRSSNSSFVVSVESLPRRLDLTGETSWVDVRSPQEFESCHTPGSLQIPLYSIKTKEFLKSKRLVLIGKGADHAGLESECERLRELGFSVSILDGGILAWSESGRPLDGPGCDKERLSRMSPRELFEAIHSDDWVVINACRDKKALASTLVPQAYSLSETENPERLITEIRSLLDASKGTTRMSHLIFDDDGSDISRLSRELSTSGLTGIFYLEGGVEGYRKFLEDQSTYATFQNHSIRKGSGKCASCP